MNALPELIGESPAIVAVREQIGRLLQRQFDARRLPPVLIQGETGTGKGLLARAIHGAGPRADGPFVDVNCAAIPETLLEAELFGFERGAFTDAKQAKPGLFQAAQRGTIFLDEAGLLPEALQAKLLKVIEERAVRRLGSTRSEPVDVWILTATNEDLAAATRARRFREDLYHRLAVLTLALPPLRERGRDVLLLAEHFLARACADYGLPRRSFSPAACAALLAHRWPGNIRELSNAMERAALLSEAAVVTAEMLGLPEAPIAESRETAPGEKATALEDAVGRVEREHLLEALEQTHWNITRAAARLGISRDTLRYRIAKHGLRSGASQPHPRPRPLRPETPVPMVPAAPPAEAPAPSSLRWEQRRLTLLRVALMVPPAADPRLYPSRALETIVEKVESFGGRIEELSPTGLVAAFGLEPVEDAQRRAAHTTMAILKAAERARSGKDKPLAVKLGIHVAQLLVGQGSGAPQIDLDGKRRAWSVLDALVERAEPDTTLVSVSAAALLERRFDLIPVGTREQTSGQAYRLAGREREGLAPGRRMARFVGRQHELELLRSCLATAMRGQGQAVGIVGEAGIGKSRLVFEFHQSLAGEPITYRESRCLSYGSAIPYLPLLEILRQNFAITDTDSPETTAEKVRSGLERVQMNPEEWAPYLLQLLGVKEGTERLALLTPEAIKTRTLETLRLMSLSASRLRPLIVAVEDLHWIDRTSEDCLTSLVDSLPGAPILFVSTYRPGYRPPWMDKSYATQIAVQPLSAQDSLSVLRSVFQTEEIPESLAEPILAKAEGNPFFLEELARAVGEHGDPGPSVRLPDPIPDTIQEVLLARVHRLPDEAKRLLQTASVLGREVSLQLLSAIWEGPENLEPHLRELMRLEFLYQQTKGTEPVYIFKHALTQEVAYESLSVSRRQALHAAVGRALETLYADRLDDAYERLAYHYSRTEQVPKAVEYLTRFAGKAARRYAHVEAVRALQEALAHVGRLPAEEQERQILDLILRQGSSLIALGRIREILDLLVRQQEGLERIGDPSRIGHYYFLLGRTYSFLGDHERAAQSAQRAIAEAERCGDEATMGKAYCLLALESPLSGQALQGIEYGRRAVELLERTREQWWLGQAYWLVGLNHTQIGEFEAALGAEAHARAIGEAIGDSRLPTFAAWVDGVIYAAIGEYEQGIEACQRGLDRSPDPLNTAICMGWLGFAYLESGDPGKAMPLLQASVQQLGRFGFRQFQGWFTVFLSECYLLTGETETAHALATQALQLAREAKYKYVVGWAQRALGRVSRARGDVSEAAAQLSGALETFTSTHAQYDAARTHLDLAALARAQGNNEGALSHINRARDLFSALKMPRYIERTERLVQEVRNSGLEGR